MGCVLGVASSPELPRRYLWHDGLPPLAENNEAKLSWLNEPLSNVLYSAEYLTVVPTLHVSPEHRLHDVNGS